MSTGDHNSVDFVIHANSAIVIVGFYLSLVASLEAVVFLLQEARLVRAVDRRQIISGLWWLVD